MNSTDIQQILNTTTSEELKRALPLIANILLAREQQQQQNSSQKVMIQSFYSMEENILAYAFFNSKDLDEAREKFAMGIQVAIETLMQQVPSDHKRKVMDAVNKTLFQSDSSVPLYF
jgi:hypothetical protein